jgi:hypothetical protein
MRLRSFSEHTCDFATLLPHVRALREQLDWPTLQVEAHDSPFAAAFLLACERLGLTAAADLAPEYHEANLHRQLTTDPRVAELGLEVQVVGDRVHVRGRLGGADCREQVTEVLNEIAPHLRIVNEVECVDLIEPAADEAEILS